MRTGSYSLPKGEPVRQPPKYPWKYWFDIKQINHYPEIVAAAPDRVFFYISRARERIQRHLVLAMQTARIEDLAPTHAEILLILARGSCSMQELAAAIDRDKSTVTALVDKLVALGYAKKTRDPEDARIVAVTATRKARKLGPAMFGLSRDLLRRAHAGFSKEDKRVLVGLLDRLYKNLGDPRG